MGVHPAPAPPWLQAWGQQWGWGIGYHHWLSPFLACCCHSTFHALIPDAPRCQALCSQALECPQMATLELSSQRSWAHRHTCTPDMPPFSSSIEWTQSLALTGYVLLHRCSPPYSCHSLLSDWPVCLDYFPIPSEACGSPSTTAQLKPRTLAVPGEPNISGGGLPGHL